MGNTSITALLWSMVLDASEVGRCVSEALLRDPQHSMGCSGLDGLEEAGGCDFRQRWRLGAAGDDPSIVVPLTNVPWALCKSQPALPPSGLAQLMGMAHSCPCLESQQKLGSVGAAFPEPLC